jgi:long-subunit fatty acid transport protein
MNKYRFLILYTAFLGFLFGMTFAAHADVMSDYCDIYPDDPDCECPPPVDPPPDIVPPPPEPEPERPGFGSGSPFTHITTVSGTGIPEIAVTPSQETGAILFEVNTPSGAIPLLIQPAGPELSLTVPPPPEPRPFRPPSIFSAPLPVGSGARALGFAGAFTSIADDATAASWNPAGLIQLKRPEVSAVYRYSRFKNDHHSDSDDFLVGSDDYESDGVNYLTASVPFQLPSFGNNMVFSINYQEAYDFVNSFNARIRDRGRERFNKSTARTFNETQKDLFIFEPGTTMPVELEIVSEITTRSSSRLDQRIETDLDADLQFKQQGVIDAISPAMAIELNPRFSLGAALNIYQDSVLAGRKIRSHTRSRYTATSESKVVVTDRRATSGTYTSEERRFVNNELQDVSRTEGAYPEIVQVEQSGSTAVRIVEGEFLEENAFDDLHGFNATLGTWLVVNDLLTLGAAVDLPWSADSRQTRTITTTSVTYDGSRSRVLGASETTEVERKDVEFEFPLFATVGAFLLWTPNLYTSLDVGFVDWSSFAYDVEGEGKISPFDGTPHGQNKVDDTWSARTGTEYLLQWDKKKIEVPLRLGLIWEQRPAIGTPDNYYGFSIGTGIAIGDDPGKLIIDFAYSQLRANDVQTVIPEQRGLSTDTRQDQFFVSIIKHF